MCRLCWIIAERGLDYITAQVTPGRMHLDRLQRLTLDALAAGATRRGLTNIEWDVAGDCQSPHTLGLSGRDDRDKLHVARPQDFEPLEARFARDVLLAFKYAKPRQMPLWLDVQVRCRKCPACLRLRRRLWSHRAATEWASSPRTWFGTLTLSPEAHYRALCAATCNLSARAVVLDALPPDEIFIERHRAISPEITKFLKRVRKNTDAPMRYLLVAEAHESGLPHYHMLLHEVDATKPIRKAAVERCWNLGFTQWRLVKDKRAASYVTKYLSKDSRSRVRASLSYGCPPERVPQGTAPIDKPLTPYGLVARLKSADVMTMTHKDNTTLGRAIVTAQ